MALPPNDLAAERMPTPRTVLGPYFTLALEPRELAGLHSGSENGAVIRVHGRLYGADGKHVPFGMVETQQPEGLTRSEIQPDGRFEIVTVKPAATDGRAPHLAVMIQIASQVRRAFTFLYFPEDDHSQDIVLQMVDEGRRSGLIAQRVADGYQVDLHISGPNETPLFELVPA